MKKEIFKDLGLETEKAHELTIALLQDFIRIPSYVDAQHNERDLSDHVAEIFEKDGHFIVERQTVEENRANLIIHDDAPPKIILFGHLDTVLPNSKTADSFDGRIEGNKLFGLGSVDMKSGLAIMVSSALRLKTPGLALIMTVDEEYDFKGAMKLVEKYQFDPKFIVNLEPSNLEILNGCRGITEFRVLIAGKTCHASRKDRGINAIEKSFSFYQELERRLRAWDLPEVKNSANFAGLTGGMSLGKNPDGSTKIIGTPNKVPEIADQLIEIRVANPKMTQADLEQLITEIAKSQQIDIESLKIKFFLGSMFTPREALALFEKALKDCQLPVIYQDVNSAGYYEVQMLQNKWGGNIVVFGPGPASLAHSVDEYVSLSGLKIAQKVIDVFLQQNSFR